MEGHSALDHDVARQAVQPSAVLETASLGVPARNAGIAVRPLVFLSVGHFAVDLFSSAVPTLQPVLTEHFQLSLAEAGLVGGVFMLSSSVLQLPFGFLADRLHSRLFSVLGLLAAGCFLSGMGLAESFYGLLAFVFLGGMGIAAFHPQSTTQAAALAGPRRGLGVAAFITCGTLGLSVGPIYFSGVVNQIGMASLWVAATPAVLVALILLWALPSSSDFNRSVNRGLDLAALQGRWRPLMLLFGLVVLRSIVQVGIAQFLTLYFATERNFSLQRASLALALFLGSAAVGSFAGGNLADRFGGRRVVLLSMIGSSPFLALFLGTTGWLSMLGLFVGGVFLLLTIPVMIVMAQELVPSQAGVVTSLMMGFAWGTAGVTFIPMIGWLGDHWGLQKVFWGLVLLPLLGYLMALKIPLEKKAAV